MKTLALNQVPPNDKISLSLHVLVVLLFFITFYSLWFLPALLRDQVLGPGDGYIQSLPAYYAPRTLWTTQLLGGFPVAADVTPQTWYPISLVISLFPKSWNAFVISSYVLASLFTYSYVYLITESVLASLVSGLTYGASGFMMAHLDHTSMIHTATWIPMTLLACEQLLRTNRKIWLAILAIAIACLFLAGHPQISVYGLTLLISYAAFFGALMANRWAFYTQFILTVVLGMGLAVVQLLPTAELAQMTHRSAMNFSDFLVYSMPLSHAVMAVFPYIFGGGNISPYKLPYIGVSLPTEITSYMGLLPLTLAWLGLRKSHHASSFRYFWAVVAFISFLLILGATTPMAWISYQIPVYNKFRILGRNAIVLVMSISVLAGLGISSIERDRVDRESLKKMLRFSISLMGLMVIWAVIACYYFLEKNKSNVAVNIIYFLNSTILPSLAIFVMGWVSLSFYAKRRSVSAAISLFTVLAIDLAAFGWFYQWQASPMSTTVLSTPVFLEKYQKKLEQQHQRFLPLQQGVESLHSQAPPNLSRIWNAPNISGYGPLLISRFGEFTSLAPNGVLISRSVLWNNQNLSLDISGVRYITTAAHPALLAPDDSTKWDKEDLSISLGKTCGLESREDVTIELPEPMEIDSIHLVGTLGCSTTIIQGTTVLKIKTIDMNGRSESRFLKAGQDLSEYTINRPDVASQIKHQAAKIFRQIPVQGETWLGNLYVTKVILNKPSTIRQLTFQIPTEDAGGVSISKISLNNSRTKTSYPLLGGRWKYIEDLGDVHIYENRNVMPRAWLTSQVQSVPPDQILAAVKTSKLANGLVFNPRQTALIEESIDFPTQVPDPNATVQVEFPSETQVRLQTKSTQPSFLVLSDVFYPGWQAHIDGKPAHIFQTNYIFRGVQLPAGEHTVTFSFRPFSFAIGCGISGASFALLLYIAFTDRKLKSPPPAILPS